MFKKYKAQIEKDLNNTFYDDNNLKKRKNLDGEKETDRTLDYVLFCLQPSIRSNISIFNLNSENNLADTILGRVCECKLH